jgi:hypothetical protein
MHLPADIETLFTQQYDGFRSFTLKSASEAIMVENALRRAHLTYRTKITRTKKHGRQFIVMLVGEADGS